MARNLRHSKVESVSVYPAKRRSVWPGNPHGAEKMTEMQNACVKTVYDYWHQIRPEGGLPHRSDFSPADITKCLPYIFIIERKKQEGAEPDYVFRLIGTQLVQYFGADPTGRSVFEVLDAEAGAFTRAHYALLLARPVGALLCFRQSFGNVESDVEFLYMPMVLDKENGEAELILCTAGKLDNEVQLSDMGGRWTTPKLISGGWLDLGFGKPDDPFLQNACAATDAEYMDY